MKNSSTTHDKLNSVEEVITHYEQALALARTIGDREAESNRLNNLGIAYKNLSQVSKAIDCYEEALALAHDVGDRRGEAFHGWNLGLLHEDTDPVRAADLMQVSVDFEREIGHPDAEADAEWVQGLRARAARENRA